MRFFDSLGMANQVLLDSVEQQISMLVVMSKRVIAAIPRQTEAESVVSELISAHESHLNSLFLNLKEQLRQRDESFESAIARSREERLFMEAEIARLEQLLREQPEMTTAASALSRTAQARNESISSSSSPLPELIDLRTRLRNQLNELESIRL